MSIIGIGTEIVECVRIAKMIDTHGEQFLQRVYTASEIDYCTNRATATQQFAARWSAKEAVMKAMRCHNQGIHWTEIEVVVNAGDGPTIKLSGVAAIWAEQMAIERLHITLAACRTHATAYAVAVDIDG
jgi:holo-[acyl-carrier protein] synthase